MEADLGVLSCGSCGTSVECLRNTRTGEAAFMTGLERNSDIVFAASYAPLLQVTCLSIIDPLPDIESLALIAYQQHTMGM